MPLPELSAEKKFIARDVQLRIMQIQEGIRSLQQKAQNEGMRLRQLIESWTAEAGLSFDKVTFDLDTLKWSELAPPPAPPVPPTPAPAPVAEPVAVAPVPAREPPAAPEAEPLGTVGIDGVIPPSDDKAPL
jgi:hypothetical protein